MRALRLFLYFLVGFFLAGVVCVANAETMPAWYTTSNSSPQPTREEACQASWASNFVQTNYAANGWVYYETTLDTCRAKNAGGDGTNYDIISRACPAGQKWTLSGESCTRPDCPSGLTYGPTGECEDNSCPQSETSGWYARDKSLGADGSLTGVYCTDGCEVSIVWDISDPNSSRYYESSTTIWQWLKRTQTGKKCSGSTPPPSGSPTPPNQPPDPPKNPPCAVGEGVIADSKGHVSCVPKSPTSDTPTVKSEGKKTTYPDGSTSETTTTQTCTGAGACSTTTITNVTGVGGVPGGPAGQAGTPGTTNSSGTSATTGGTGEQSDFCSTHPSAQICRGGMNEEDTQRHILTEIYKLTDTSGEAPDVKDLSDAGKKPLSDLAAKGQDGKDELTRQEEAISDYATGKKSDPLTDEKRSAWAEAMNSGWFDSVPESGCQATDAQIGPFTWHFDICPIAAKIADIGAYAMWFMLAVGTFVMITGGRKE